MDPASDFRLIGVNNVGGSASSLESLESSDSDELSQLEVGLARLDCSERQASAAEKAASIFTFVARPYPDSSPPSSNVDIVQDFWRKERSGQSTSQNIEKYGQLR